MDYDIAEIDRLSGTTAAQRSTNFRWLSQQGEQTLIEAIKIQTDLIRQFRRANQGQIMSPEFGYAMHSLAVQKMVWLETAQRRKGDKLSDAEYQKVQEVRVERIRAKQRTKGSPKRELIRVRFFNLIEDLRQKNLSWRQISDYLATHHREKMAYSYIRDTYNQLTSEIKKTGL